jgi:hypothetical protein
MPFAHQRAAASRAMVTGHGACVTLAWTSGWQAPARPCRAAAIRLRTTANRQGPRGHSGVGREPGPQRAGFCVGGQGHRGIQA